MEKSHRTGTGSSTSRCGAPEQESKSWAGWWFSLGTQTVTPQPGPASQKMKKVPHHVFTLKTLKLITLNVLVLFFENFTHVNNVPSSYLHSISSLSSLLMPPIHLPPNFMAFLPFVIIHWVVSVLPYEKGSRAKHISVGNVPQNLALQTQTDINCRSLESNSRKLDNLARWRGCHSWFWKRK